MGEAGGLFLTGSPALSRNCKLVEQSAGKPEYPLLLRHTLAFAERGWRTSICKTCNPFLVKERVFCFWRPANLTMAHLSPANKFAGHNCKVGLRRL